MLKGSILVERKIRLTQAQEVKEFVTAADHCDFDVDVQDKSKLVDGKSLFEVISLELNQIVTVKYAGVDSQFEMVLKKYQTQ